MASWRRLTGVVMLAAGAVAAGAGVVIAAEKIAVGRIRLRPDSEADEQLEPKIVPWPEALRMALDGTIKDAKTITSILLWDRIRNAE